MTVEDGLIRTHGGMGLLYWTGGKMSNCVLRVVYEMRDQNDNSGVFIRIPIEPREEWMPVHYGYEVQIDNEPEKSNEDEYHVTGTLYGIVASVLGLGYLWFTIRFARIVRDPDSEVSRRAARNLLRASVIYLPLLLATMMLDAKGRLLF